MALDQLILRIVKEAGQMGITAQQMAYKIGKKREIISHYLWVLKKAGKITNINRNLWIAVNMQRKVPQDESESSDKPSSMVVEYDN